MSKTQFGLIKKTLVPVLAATSMLFAESYQVNTLSARQLGMAHTGAALKLGSESMHFNPGGLGFLDKTLDISAGVTFIIPEVEFHGKNGKTTNTELGTPIYFYAASSITDWLSVGISFTTPYGNTVKYGKDWEGAGIVQDISLAVYTLQPTVAIKPIEQLSIGIGPTINFGSFEQSKAAVYPGKLNAYSALAQGLRQLAQAQADAQVAATYNSYANTVDGIVNDYRDISAVSVTLEGDADVGIGFHAGALYDIIPNKLSVGVSYRSEVEMKIAKGKTTIDSTISQLELTTLNTIATAAGAQTVYIPTMDQGNFKAALPLPSNMNVGISFRPIEKLLLAFDLQWVGWKSYDSLIVKWDENVLIPTTGEPYEQRLAKNYHNTFAYRFGAQYTLLDQLDVRLGMYYDETPVDDDYLTAESPSTNKLGSTIGFSFRPIPNLSIDASFLYALGFGRDSKSVSKLGEDNGLNGRYEVQAWVPSVGLSFNF